MPDDPVLNVDGQSFKWDFRVRIAASEYFMTDLLKRKLVSESTSTRIAQVLASVASILIMVLGGLKVTALELTESQLLLGLGILFTISLQFAVIVMLLDLKRASSGSERLRS